MTGFAQPRNPLKKHFLLTPLIAIFFLGLSPIPAYAYIGPGAGFAFISSFFIIFIAFLLAFFSFLFWPIRFFFRVFRRRKIKTTPFDRVVVLGLDGLSPEIIESLMEDGTLPNFYRLKEQGYFSSLKTTNPPISPVAWSSFQTGVNPGKHNIFDFLTRDPKTYFPLLSFSKTGKPRRFFQAGKWRIPLSRPTLTLLRKSKPFWEILGENGIFSTVIRVPVTFPPAKFQGHLLSAMGTPDLKGTQGTFTFYTTRKEKAQAYTVGTQITVEKKSNRIESYIPGPENPFCKEAEELKVTFTLELFPLRKEVKIKCDGTSVLLRQGEYSPWLRFAFKPFPGVSIKGIGRFLVRQIEPEFDMYLTPLNIDPENPALPISYPFIYSVYLAKLLGSYATLGEAEDTWALNEQVISDNEFLKQCYLIYAERKEMLFQSLKKTKTGVCVCVFDTPDRIQHMFWRDGNNALVKRGGTHYPLSIQELYCRMDDLIGEVMGYMREKDVLFVLSDHGITSFQRCFNLNTWLYQNGYLALKKNGSTTKDFFANVDWEKTVAFGVGMAGLYINQKGREKYGIVEPGKEKETLKAELVSKLTGLKDEETGAIAILNVYDPIKVYAGPYLDNGPDLVIGCNQGYRIGWDSVVGKPSDKVFEDNLRKWRADHCVDTTLVPGVLFCNHKLEVVDPAIIDLAPTILDLLGIPRPSYMDGKAMKIGGKNQVSEDKPGA